MAAGKKRKAQQKKTARVHANRNSPGSDDFMKFARRSLYRLFNDVKKVLFSKRGGLWLKG